MYMFIWKENEIELAINNFSSRLSFEDRRLALAYLTHLYIVLACLFGIWNKVSGS